MTIDEFASSCRRIARLVDKTGDTVGGIMTRPKLTGCQDADRALVHAWRHACWGERDHMEACLQDARNVARKRKEENRTAWMADKATR